MPRHPTRPIFMAATVADHADMGKRHGRRSSNEIARDWVLGGRQPRIVSTARNRALPLSIRS